MDKALTLFEERSRLGKELYAAYPQNVDFKNGLAISYTNLGVFSRDELKDSAKAKGYFQQAEKLWSELVRDAPQYAGFQRSLRIVQENLANLDLANDLVSLLNVRIQNEPDSLAQYAIYTILCDTLRQRAKTDPQQKPALAKALTSRAWLGFFLASRSVGVTSSHPDTWSAIEADVREGMALDPDNQYLPSNLAPALLFQGKKYAAISEYKKWMDKPFNKDYPTYREAFLDDLNTFEKAGIIPEARRGDVAAVRKLLAGK